MLYAWKGLNATGKVVSGTREADGAKVLRQTLRKDGIFITDLREAASGERKGQAQSSGSALNREVDFARFLERVRPQDVAVFTRQLATLLKAGIPLAEGLGALAEQQDNKKMERVLAEVRQKVNEGTALADALTPHKALFPELYVNMVRSGEAAGNLDSVLFRLADFLDAQQALRAKVSGALTYPLIMTIMGGLVMSVLLIVVVPQITSVFQDMGKTLPWNTQLLIAVSSIAGGYWWIVLPVLGLCVYLFRRWAATPKGRGRLDRFKIKLPLLGPLIRYVGVARFSRTLATMLGAGVPLLTALEITKKVINNVVLEKVIEEARDAIREGEPIAAPLKRSGQFPPMMVHMVSVGERSGQLETMLDNVSGAYERDVDEKVARLTTVLSPLIIVIMALGVVFIVFSILGPILEMQNFAQ